MALKSNFTANMARDMLKGRSVKSAFGIPSSLLQNHSGSLKQMNDHDISRLILKLLIMSGLEEQFVTSLAAGNNKNITVYLGLGKKFQHVLIGKLAVNMSVGLKQGEESKNDSEKQK